jgi:hypothetical protein
MLHRIVATRLGRLLLCRCRDPAGTGHYVAYLNFRQFITDRMSEAEADSEAASTAHI